MGVLIIHTLYVCPRYIAHLVVVAVNLAMLIAALGKHKPLPGQFMS